MQRATRAKYLCSLAVCRRVQPRQTAQGNVGTARPCTRPVGWARDRPAGCRVLLCTLFQGALFVLQFMFCDMNKIICSIIGHIGHAIRRRAPVRHAHVPYFNRSKTDWRSGGILTASSPHPRRIGASVEAVWNDRQIPRRPVYDDTLMKLIYIYAIGHYLK